MSSKCVVISLLEFVQIHGTQYRDSTIGCRSMFQRLIGFIHLNLRYEREVERLAFAALDHLQHVLASAYLFKEGLQIYPHMAFSKTLKFGVSFGPLASGADIVAAPGYDQHLAESALVTCRRSSGQVEPGPFWRDEGQVDLFVEAGRQSDVLYHDHAAELGARHGAVADLGETQSHGDVRSDRHRVGLSRVGAYPGGQVDCHQQQIGTLGPGLGQRGHLA